MAHCGPGERRVVERIPCPDTKQSAADKVGLGQSYLPRLAEVLNSKLAHAFTRPQWLKQPAILARRTWPQRPKLVQDSLESAGALVCEFSPTLPRATRHATFSVLHREILHVHASLELILGILRTRFALLSTPFPSPHLQVQLRGLDSAILQATQVTHTALHYTHELMTTFGLIHTLTLNHSPEQLAAELRGRTSFLDPSTFVSPIPDSRPSTSTTSTTATSPTGLRRFDTGPSRRSP